MSFTYLPDVKNSLELSIVTFLKEVDEKESIFSNQFIPKTMTEEEKIHSLRIKLLMKYMKIDLDSFIYLGFEKVIKEGE
jgi:hypothetical protein